MSKYSKGVSFEKEAFERIQEVLESNYIFDYYLISDVAYQGINRFEQIDAMLVCKYGVYCLEMKNWKGEVHPNNDDMWPIYENGVKTHREFPNPTIQNNRHCASIKYLIDQNYAPFKNKPVYNLVVFSDNTEISESEKDNVVYLDDIAKYIVKHNANVPEDICRDIIKILKYFKNKYFPKYRELHMHQIKTIS